MDEAPRQDSDAWPADQQTPDGLQGTPAERFTEAARRVFAADKEQVAAAEKAGERPKGKRGRPAKNKK